MSKFAPSIHSVSIDKRLLLASVETDTVGPDHTLSQMLVYTTQSVSSCERVTEEAHTVWWYYYSHMDCAG